MANSENPTTLLPSNDKTELSCAYNHICEHRPKLDLVHDEASNLTYPATPLGQFQRLPCEIRCEVWHYLMPDRKQKFNLFGKMSLGSSLAILRTSHEICWEVSAIFYNRDLHFHIRNPNWEGGDLKNPMRLRQSRASFSKFKRITFEIEPPDRSGQVQVNRLRN